MNQLTEAGLTEATRIGKWTYFKRNEKALRTFSEYIKSEF